MQTQFEHFAVTSMLGQGDSPPRLDGKLCFGQAWERQAFGVALALAKQKLISAIGEWESSHSLDDSSWSYYERWLTALERLVIEERLVTPEELTARMPGVQESAAADRMECDGVLNAPLSEQP
jgi:hypothetical protein